MVDTSPAPANSPVAEIVLEKVLSLLAHDWVHDFLLATTRQRYIDQIYAALNLPSVTPVQFSFSSRSPHPGQPFELDEHRNLLMLTSFTRGNLSAGFEITETVKSTSPGNHNNPFQVSPVVRDDKNGIILVIGQQPKTGILEINCCIQSSPGVRHQVLAFVHSMEFRRAVANIANGYDPHAVRDSIIMSYASLDARRCVGCGSVSFQPCKCPLICIPKTHHHEYQRDIMNVATFIGSFRGVATMTKQTPQGFVSISNLITTVGSVFSTDNERRTKLSFWAMLDATSRNKFAVSKTTMPLSGSVPFIDAASPLEALDYALASDTPRQARHILPHDEEHEASHRPTAHPGTHSHPIILPSNAKGAYNHHSGQTSNGRIALSQHTHVIAVPNSHQPNLAAGVIPIPMHPVLIPNHFPAKAGRRLTPLAPAPGVRVSKVTANSGPEKGSIEYRRAQNRASAKKSNEKRKRRIQQLQDDIDIANEEKEALKRRVEELRKENEELKKKASYDVEKEEEGDEHSAVKASEDVSE